MYARSNQRQLILKWSSRSGEGQALWLRHFAISGSPKDYPELLPDRALSELQGFLEPFLVPDEPVCSHVDAWAQSAASRSTSADPDDAPGFSDLVEVINKLWLQPPLPYAPRPRMTRVEVLPQMDNANVMISRRLVDSRHPHPRHVWTGVF